MPIYDGNSVRFTAADHPVGTLQREIAESMEKGRASNGSAVAAPTLTQILDGLPHHKRYDERTSNAWRDPKPGGST